MRSGMQLPNRSSRLVVRSRWFATATPGRCRVGTPLPGSPAWCRDSAIGRSHSDLILSADIIAIV
jgi:hypothetical protein